MTKKTVSHPGEAMTNYTDKASGVEFNCWIGSYSLERSMWALKTCRCNEGGLRCVEKPKQFGKFLNNKCTGWLNSTCGKTMGEKKKIMTEIRKCSQFKNTLEEVAYDCQGLLWRDQFMNGNMGSLQAGENHPLQKQKGQIRVLENIKKILHSF